jgi:hypothetical protein
MRQISAYLPSAPLFWTKRAVASWRQGPAGCLPHTGILLAWAGSRPGRQGVLLKRHPACRRREAQLGSCTERENLDGDAKGKECPKLEAGCRHRFGSCGWAGL